MPPSSPRTVAATPRRWSRRLAWVLAGLLIGLAVLPYLVAATPLRNVVVRSMFADQGLETSADGASLGWMTPAELRGLALRPPGGEPLLEIARLRTDRPWWRLLWTRADVGRLDVERPAVRLTMADDGSITLPQRQTEGVTRPPPTLIAALHDAAFALRVAGNATPAVAFEGLDAVVRIEQQGAERVLVVDPFQPLDRAALSPAMCRRGLELVAPVLAGATNVEGEVSLALARCRVPLANAEQADIAGRLELHAVETGLANPLQRRISALVGAVLGRKLPAGVRIVDESAIEFRVADGRVYHEGLAFGLPETGPDLVVRTRGSVGLDRSLDLQVELPLPLERLPDLPLLSRLGSGPLRLAVRGTLEAPQFQLADPQGPLAQLLAMADDGSQADGGAPPPGEAAALAGAILDVVRETLSRRNEAPPDEAGRMERLKAWRERRRERKDEVGRSGE